MLTFSSPLSLMVVQVKRERWSGLAAVGVFLLGCTEYSIRISSYSVTALISTVGVPCLELCKLYCADDQLVRVVGSPCSAAICPNRGKCFCRRLFGIHRATVT